MWHLGLQSNNRAFWLSKNHFSNDIRVVGVLDNSEHETFYLFSPHFSYMTDEEYEKAYFRAIAMVRLINGCILLNNNYLLYPDDHLTDFPESYSRMVRGSIVSGKSLMEYEQFINPFDDLNINDIKGGTYFIRCLTLVRKNSTVRRVIGLLYLYYRDNLYSLVNSYKIYEIILGDLEIPKNKKDYKAMHNTLDFETKRYLDYFIIGNFTHYANTLVNSTGNEVTGIFSRHGYNSNTYDGNPIDFNELDYNLKNLINRWLCLKIKEEFNEIYDEIYEPTNHISF